jgi:23S rRNA pseudouridine1911/1915/1917 synthase
MSDTRWRVGPDEAGERLDRFLAAPDRLGSRGRASTALEKGKVFVNDAEATAADAARRVEPDDVVRLWMDRPGSARTRTRAVRHGRLDILYDDAVIVVVNKPAGLLTVPLARSDADSVQHLLASGGGRAGRRPLPVHRIDRDTSGLVVFAKTSVAQSALKEQFVRREPDRRYLAVVHGTPEPASGTWRDHLRWNPDDLAQEVGSGRHARSLDAVTHYRVVERFARASLLEVRLETGRRNQIRVQAVSHGHPLVGERQYAAPATATIEFARQALHAQGLSFLHPVDGRRMSFTAPMPPDLDRLLASLRAGRTAHL